MISLNPLLLVGGVIGTVSVLLLIAYACVKDKKTAMGFERSMADGEILRRLFGYAKPYLRQFIVVGFLVLFSISYDIASPLIVGYIEELVVGDFELKSLYVSVAVYAGVLVFSMASTYLQAVILQRVGQRIISDLREDLFTHIESLSHGQLNDIPVGKLVTRVTNDTNAISMMFTNLFVNLTKNAFVILGILVAMLCLNYELTLMVLCFVPFILLFTVIFRKFSRRAYRKVKDATTDINTYLSENLSGIKVTQIFGREDEKMEEFRQKSQTLAKAAGADLRLRRLPSAGVYAVYQLDPLPVLSRRHGPSEPCHLPWADHFQRHHRHLLYVYLQVLHPHPEPRRAVQLAAVGAGVVGEGLLHHGHPAPDGGCPRCR